MAVRRQHPEPDDPPQRNWRAGPGGVPIPPKAEKLRKRQPSATVKFEKPPQQPRGRGEESVCGIEYSGTLRYPSGRPLKYCIWIGLNHPKLVA
jgi:hypothetical protein